MNEKKQTSSAHQTRVGAGEAAVGHAWKR
jgi:uncharacterized protein (DUF736 family)